MMADQLILLPCGPIASQEAPPPPLASILPGTLRGPDGWRERLAEALDGVECWVPRAGGWIPLGPLRLGSGAGCVSSQWDRISVTISFDLGAEPAGWRVVDEDEEAGDG